MNNQSAIDVTELGYLLLKNLCSPYLLWFIS